eukprot:123238_1
MNTSTFGLYDRNLDRDACGVGFVADLCGSPSRRTISDALTILCRLEHRGAVGADPDSGDGAGLLTDTPHDFLKAEVRRNGVELPPRGKYGCGLLFLPKNRFDREKSKRLITDIVEELGHSILCWRDVPVDSSSIGKSALEAEPKMEHIFVGAPHTVDFVPESFERTLFIIRKRITHAFDEFKTEERSYVVSLSAHSLVYKGQLKASQLGKYFKDITNPMFTARMAMVHSRFSTNTNPSWDRAQPYRQICHNGEINALRGNVNWMRAREGVMTSEVLGGSSGLKQLFPVIEDGVSDSGSFDNALEFLTFSGRAISEAILLMVPEAWQNDRHMPQHWRSYYEYHSCLMEPWDGPALLCFSNGKEVGAILDRNGLRPGRYYRTRDSRLIFASEVGVLDIEPENILEKGRLQPGKMLLVDLDKGCLIGNDELKNRFASKHPYGKWLAENKLYPQDGSFEGDFNFETKCSLGSAQTAHGITSELVERVLLPMARDGYEALGSMGTDTPLACLSALPRRIGDYFKQMFAQVTNPPIDPIREAAVMSLLCTVGPEGNVLGAESASACRRLSLEHPVLSREEFQGILGLDSRGWKSRFIDMLFRSDTDIQTALYHMCQQAADAIADGCKVIVLSHQKMCSDQIPVSSLMCIGAVHHFLIKNALRSKVALIAACGDTVTVHDYCLSLGFGVDAIYPFICYDTLKERCEKEDGDHVKWMSLYRSACAKGILKVMSKMGISTLQSYKGAQIFEALGICKSVVDVCFTGCPTRIGGATFSSLAKDMTRTHARAFPSRSGDTIASAQVNSGLIHWQNQGEIHLNSPEAISLMQRAAKENTMDAFKKYTIVANRLSERCTLRGQLDFVLDKQAPVPLDEVEPAAEIVKRFVTGAASYGSISIEAHEALALAMNSFGAKSNTGEGGESVDRFAPLPDGRSKRSAIKQVASARFGVNIHYLSNADEIQIKMAQGAKPGEGGELPSHKVLPDIAKVRHSTPMVGLISPPPHHDIYSIEDLAQLIFDLKSANRAARVSVKLVSEVGVGVVASGVVKSKADHILISGHDGGTGASRLTGIKHAGLPWELGLAETQHALVTNGLRSRVCIQTDGALRTGRDVCVAALLGADEFGFTTAPLITLGCVMMRKCHLNTCPVGIATQDPVLREKFSGKPEYVVNFFFMLAEDIRGTMAQMGFRRMDEMIGRSEFLQMRSGRSKVDGELDLTNMLWNASPTSEHSSVPQSPIVDEHFDHKILSLVKSSIKTGNSVKLEMSVTNRDRCVGGILSNEITKSRGLEGLPDGTIQIAFSGHGGQSFGAWLAPGVEFFLNGDSNDYVGKGLSGGIITVVPPESSTFNAENNIIIGNVALYGATAGKAFFSGIAAERFCVRNSGACAVVEGVGDHGCEYMTGGVAVILGRTGRNFAAGMSGGLAFVYDEDDSFGDRCNQDMVYLEKITLCDDDDLLRSLISEHSSRTHSKRSNQILENWTYTSKKFVKVFPKDYKRALALKGTQKSESAPSKIGVGCEAKRTNGELNATTSARSILLDIEDFGGKATKVSKAGTCDIRPVEIENPIKRFGFLKYQRRDISYRDPELRVSDFSEIQCQTSTRALKTQSARCMDCGVPFCHEEENGCPLGNRIPEWNDLVHKNSWKEALERLLATNNFPEFTSRVCPAPCEGACVLGLIDKPVSIKSIEAAIIDRAFEENWIKPIIPETRTGRKVAVIGSGPAGLACADQLNKAGHLVTVFERSDRIGGLLMYGIPNMKLAKKSVDRRVALLKAEGIRFKINSHITNDAPDLLNRFDALCLAVGSTRPRDLAVPGRNHNGIHFAMEFLSQNTKSLLDSGLKDGNLISAKDKRVIVIGGGDTGTDCIGTAMRHGCKSLVNFELLSMPPDARAADNPWPLWPIIFRVDYGHAEASTKFGEDPRIYCVLTEGFDGDENGDVCAVKTVRIKWEKTDSGRWAFNKIVGSESVFVCDLVLLALGFIGPERAPSDALGLEHDMRGNVRAQYGKFCTSNERVFAAGDCRRGQSLVVRAMAEGRQAAREIDVYLTDESFLP